MVARITLRPDDCHVSKGRQVPFLTPHGTLRPNSCHVSRGHRYLPSHHATHSALTIVMYQKVIRYLPYHHATHSSLTVITYQGVVMYSTQGYFDQENFLTAFARRVDNVVWVP